MILSTLFRAIAQLLTQYADEADAVPATVPGLPAAVAKTTPTPSQTSTFDAALAGLTPKLSYIFGSARVAAATDTVIADQASLAAHFNAFEDYTALWTINCELQRYQPFNPVNHAIGPDRLTLTPDLPGGSWPVILCESPAGTLKFDGVTPIPMAQLGLKTTSGIWTGHLCAIQNVGLYVVKAMTSDVSLTLGSVDGSPTSIGGPVFIAFPRIFAMQSTTALTSANTFTVASIPGWLTPGMAVGYMDLSKHATLVRNADVVVKAIAGNTVTLSGPLGAAIVAGATYVFLPRITSGQIWTKDHFDIGTPGSWLAIEFDGEVFADTPGRKVNSSGINALWQFLQADGTIPWGGWFGLWLYSANEGAGNDSSEIDILEVFCGGTTSPFFLSGGDIGPGAKGATYNLATDVAPKWWSSGAFNINSGATGPAKTQLIFADGKLYRYYNGLLLKISTFTWTSKSKAQLGIDIASGSISMAFAKNFLFPMSPKSIAAQATGVKGIKVWHG